MDSKWGIPLIAILAGLGIWSCARSTKVVKEADYPRDLARGWPRTYSPEPTLALFQKSQLANREYYRQLMEKEFAFNEKPLDSPEMLELKRQFTFYNDLCERAGILEDDEVESEWIPLWSYRPLIEKYRLRTKDEWKDLGYSDVGGPLNPMELYMGIKQSRINAQNYLGAIEPQKPIQWRKALRRWEQGKLQMEDPALFKQIRDADPRFEYYDFDISANARELYFFQFTLTGMTFLQRWGKGLDLKMPFDYFKCVQFMNDFLIQEAFMGGWMESRAIHELTQHPNWPSDWKIAKSHKSLDGKGVDLVVYVDGHTLPDDTKKDGKLGDFGRRGLIGTTDYTDVVGLIQVKPYSWIHQNMMLKKEKQGNRTTDLDRLRGKARSFHNPDNAGSHYIQWDLPKENRKNLKDKTGRYKFRPFLNNPDKSAQFPKIPVSDYNFVTDEQGNIETEQKVDSDTGETTIQKVKNKSVIKGLSGAKPHREKFLLQLLVYEKEKTKEAGLQDAHWLNDSAVVQRIIDNLQDPVLEIMDDDRENPKNPTNWWVDMSKDTILHQ